MKGSNRPPQNHPWRKRLFRTRKWNSDGPKLPVHVRDETAFFDPEPLPVVADAEVAE